jgi:hypothetical protein
MSDAGSPRSNSQECFVTLFDQAYLSYGLVLARSLRRQLPGARLLVIAMGDPKLVDMLDRLGFPPEDIIPIAEVEARHPALAQVKPSRHAGEYCWTVTPFAVDAALTRCPWATRATYLDADLWFCDSPLKLLDEMAGAGRQVLITEHAFTPAYTANERFGRFCVQFMPFTRDSGAQEVLRSWQQQCIDWCFDRYDGERFGDQKYLDNWPTRFPDVVHVCAHPEWSQAPWNRARFADHQPVFYHCHSLRLVAPDRLMLHRGYHLTARQAEIYGGVVADHAWAIAELAAVGIAPVLRPRPLFSRLVVDPLLVLVGRARFTAFSATLPATKARVR